MAELTLEELIKKFKKDRKSEQFKSQTLSDLEQIKQDYIIPTLKSVCIKLFDKYIERNNWEVSTFLDCSTTYEYVNLATTTYRSYVDESIISPKMITRNLFDFNECVSKIDYHNQGVWNEIRLLNKWIDTLESKERKDQRDIDTTERYKNKVEELKKDLK
jgi:hypothetical protein